MSDSDIQRPDKVVRPVVPLLPAPVKLPHGAVTAQDLPEDVRPPPFRGIRYPQQLSHNLGKSLYSL